MQPEEKGRPRANLCSRRQERDGGFGRTTPEGLLPAPAGPTSASTSSPGTGPSEARGAARASSGSSDGSAQPQPALPRRSIARIDSRPARLPLLSKRRRPLPAAAAAAAPRPWPGGGVAAATAFVWRVGAPNSALRPPQLASPGKAPPRPASPCPAGQFRRAADGAACRPHRALPGEERSRLAGLLSQRAKESHVLGLVPEPAACVPEGRETLRGQY